jgi:MoxR-like ATPase
MVFIDGQGGHRVADGFLKMTTTRVKIKDAIKQLTTTFVERDQAVLCIWLALLTRANFILVGDPGTAKTALVHAVYSHIEGARTFSMLCGSFATEDKVFGPVDIKAFQEGEYRKVIKKRLADCELGFLDEMMKANEGTLNGMLTALNERTYEGAPIPLRTLGAATNWPEVRARTDNVAALWDRLLLRAEVCDIKGEKERVRLLEAVDKVKRYKPSVVVTLAELDAAAAEVDAVTIESQVRNSIVQIQASLEKQKIFASSRRYGALQQALRAMAWLDGRTEVRLDDFDALSFGLWTDREQIDQVKAVVDAVDHEVVTNCVSKLKEATSQCRGNAAPTAIPRLLQLAATASNEARTLLENRGARTKGREQIKTEINKLRVVYQELRGKIPTGIKATSMKSEEI